MGSFRMPVWVTNIIDNWYPGGDMDWCVEWWTLSTETGALSVSHEPAKTAINT